VIERALAVARRKESKIILIAAAGWFLMGPPNNDSKRPISEWIRLKSFDSAKECEKFADEINEKVALQKAKDPKSVLFTEIFLHTRCIPSDFSN
jgi:hypothetical protein